MKIKDTIFSVKERKEKEIWKYKKETKDFTKISTLHVQFNRTTMLFFLVSTSVPRRKKLTSFSSKEDEDIVKLLFPFLDINFLARLSFLFLVYFSFSFSFPFFFYSFIFFPSFVEFQRVIDDNDASCLPREFVILFCFDACLGISTLKATL